MGYRASDPPPKKKRGRPNKEEFERRVAEAKAKGEIYPKPRKAKPRPGAAESSTTEDPAAPGGGVGGEDEDAGSAKTEDATANARTMHQNTSGESVATEAPSTSGRWPGTPQRTTTSDTAVSQHLSASGRIPYSPQDITMSGTLTASPVATSYPYPNLQRQLSGVGGQVPQPIEPRHTESPPILPISLGSRTGSRTGTPRTSTPRPDPAFTLPPIQTSGGPSTPQSQLGLTSSAPAQNPYGLPTSGTGFQAWSQQQSSGP